MENNNPATSQQTSPGSTGNIYQVSLLDLLVILVRQRFFIIKFTSLFALLAILYSLLATPVYKSTLQIMPPGGDAKSGAVAVLAASGLGDLAGGFGATQGDTVVGITKSTVVLDRVIDKNGLLTREPEGFNLTRAVKGLFASSEEEKKPKMRTMVRASLSEQIQSAADKKSGIISVSVSDTSPEMAVQLAQSVFDETLDVMQDVAVTPSAKQRLFIEEQLKENNKALAEAENNLSAFLKDTGMSSPSGTPSDIGSLGALQARMVAKEIEIKAARRFATDANPKLKQLQAEYNAIKKQFEANKGMLNASSGTGEIKNITESSLQYAALFREYKFRESLVTILLRQYETAKIREAQDPVVIQLLSPPTIPEIRSKPQRKKIVVLATLLGGFLAVFIAFIKHFLSLSAKDPQVGSKVDFIRNTMLSDLSKLRRKK
jgi:tyrosine-protein kinase Etk/Wzc